MEGANMATSPHDLAMFVSERAKQPSHTTLTLPAVFCFIAVVALGFALQIAYGSYQIRALAAIGTAFLACCGALLCARVGLLLPLQRKPVWSAGFALLITVFFLGGLVTLHKSPRPESWVDVDLFQNDAAAALLHGSNPYASTMSHKNIYGKNGLNYYGAVMTASGRIHVGDPYPPLSLLWTIPGYLLGDLRYAFLVAILLSATAMFYLSPGLEGFVTAALFMTLPMTFFVLQQSWTEPLMVVTLAAVVVAREKSPKLLPIALGFFFASKQHSALAVPLAALLLPHFSWKAFLSLVTRSLAVSAVINALFFLWDPNGFWWSLVGFQIAQPVRPDSLSFSALLVNHGWAPIPQEAVIVAVLLAIWFALTKAPRSSFGFSLSIAVVYLPFFALNKQAFCNYYFFVFGALCLGLVVARREKNVEYAIVKLAPSHPEVQI